MSMITMNYNDKIISYLCCSKLSFFKLLFIHNTDKTCYGSVCMKLFYFLIILSLQFTIIILIPSCSFTFFTISTFLIFLKCFITGFLFFYGVYYFISDPTFYFYLQYISCYCMDRSLVCVMLLGARLRRIFGTIVNNS